MQDLSALASLWSMTEIFRLNRTFWHPELHPQGPILIAVMLLFDFHYKSDWIKTFLILNDVLSIRVPSLVLEALFHFPILNHFILFVLSSSYKDIYLASVNINLFHSCLALKTIFAFCFHTVSTKRSERSNVFRNIALDTYNNVMVILCWWFWRISLFYISLRR